MVAPIVKKFIATQIRAGVGWTFARRNYYNAEASHPGLFPAVSGTDFADEFARMYDMSDKSNRTVFVNKDARPGFGLMHETMFKVPSRYRYRVRMEYENLDTGETDFRYVSMYSDSRLTMGEAADDAMRVWRADAGEKYRAMAMGNYVPTGNNQLVLLEHNEGMDY